MDEKLMENQNQVHPESVREPTTSDVIKPESTEINFYANLEEEFPQLPDKQYVPNIKTVWSLKSDRISKIDTKQKSLPVLNYQLLKPKLETESVKKLTTIDRKSLENELKEKIVIKSQIERRPFVKRPNFLSEGRKVELLTNHFLLNIGCKTAFHYDIDIEAEQSGLQKFLGNIVDREVIEKINTKGKKSKYTRKMATSLNRKIFDQMVKSYSGQKELFDNVNPVYDGQKNMFTSKILAGTECYGIERKTLRLKVLIKENEKINTFYINIKLAETNNRIDLNILNLYHNGLTCDDESVKKSILFINTLLRHKSTMELVAVGQSFFDSKIPGQAIGKSIFLSYGHYSSVRNLMIGPTLNIDRSAACFYRPSKVEDLIANLIDGNLWRVPALSDSERRLIKRELSGIQVEATHISYKGNSGKYNRKYRVLGVSSKPANEHKFLWIEKDSNEKECNSRSVSIAEYFTMKYGIELKYPHLPCLEVGNASNKVYLPFEVCKILPNQRLKRSLTNEERSLMTTIAGSQSPVDRIKQIENYVKEQYITGQMSQKNKPFLYEFGIDVSQELLEVESKIIPPPKLLYNGNKFAYPEHGEWEMHKSHHTFLRPASLQKWIIINISFNPAFTDRDINEFSRDFIGQGREMGINLAQHLLVVKIPKFAPKITFSGIKSKLRNRFPGLEMILFVTPIKSHPNSDEIYSEIKLMGDVQDGWATQCVNVANIWNLKEYKRKWNRSYLRQLMLKINPKLGGTNVALSETQAMPSILRDRSLMIIGADVNHPAPADRITPSIAAVVGSYDNEFTNYYTTVSMQPKCREEMIKKLDEMVLELLDNYQKNQNFLPQKIIFFRDGVSDGQFQQVIDNEYSLLCQAFKRYGNKYKPQITFIVVQKRHHTRFIRRDLYRNPNTAVKHSNISSGTVVDTNITHKTDFDFYLCSHEGKIGTSRAAHYYVLTDENGFNANDMCKMTYYLCHIYARCTKSVSIPAPVFYADLAAYRAKIHASGFQEIDYSSSDSSPYDEYASAQEESAQEENKIKSYEQIIKVKADQKLKLYYC